MSSSDRFDFVRITLKGQFASSIECGQSNCRSICYSHANRNAIAHPHTHTHTSMLPSASSTAVIVPIFSLIEIKRKMLRRDKSSSIVIARIRIMLRNVTETKCSRSSWQRLTGSDPSPIHFFLCFCTSLAKPQIQMSLIVSNGIAVATNNRFERIVCEGYPFQVAKQFRL
jgi:hypothetical protein